MAALVRSALKSLLFSTSLIPLSALPALAQSAADPAPAAQSDQSLPEVVITANQVPVEESKVGSAVTVITGDELRANGVNTVPDALREAAGLAVNTSGGAGALTQVRMRGLKPNQLLVQIDGVQVNEVENGGFDFAGFLVDDIERIEVLRGPQSGLYGSNAQAGVISVITKSGRGLAKPQLDGRIEGGTRNSGGGTLSVRGATGPVYGAFSVSSESTRGFNFSRFGSETDGSRSTVVNGKAGIDFNEYFNVEGGIRWTDRGTKADDVDFYTNGLLMDTADTQSYDSFIGNAVATMKLWDGRFIQTVGFNTFENNLYYNSPAWGNSAYYGQRNTFDTKSVLKFDTPWLGGASNTLSFGADYQHEEFRQSAPAVGDLYARARTGVFAEHMIDLPAGLSLTGAVRYDDFDAFQDATTWRFTASQKLAHGTRLHASVGTGVTQPTFVQQFGYYYSNFVPNPSLNPESSTGWDFGIEQTLFDGRLAADVTYFSMNLEDEITLATVGTARTVVNSPISTSRQGVEVTLRADPLSWLSIEGSYTYTDAEAYDTTLLTTLGAIRVPQNAASLRAIVKFAEGRGRATLAVVQNSGMTDNYTYWPAPTYNTVYNRVALDAYTVVNGLISYDLTPNTTIYLRGDNLFDETYEEVFSYVAPGRVIYAGLKAKFGH
ncbi:TonB-dependent receptor plug domain-containing protein [Blastochloris tepida]|uniref:TonB-dependent receptor n=1 Tax=Blastochloris tepida TaxID=2233851 RepID=A0A348FZF9_9HYPH|nr:TonB-dependent receptor [Blastochloris tepida]BBF92692.1 TonB-dependent receptor [Blastochloris tepida]